MVLAGLLVADVAPVLCLALLWLCYLSLVTAGQTFLGFQWDILLLEAGFLSLFIAPLQFRPQWWTRKSLPPPAPLPRTGLFLLRWLLFRLDVDVRCRQTNQRRLRLVGLLRPCGITTKPSRYQPGSVGTRTSFRTAFHGFSVGFVFVLAELVAPFLIFGPRRVRLIGLRFAGALAAIDRRHGQLWLLQSADPGAVPVAAG